MAIRVCLLSFIILELIPGVFCRYDYDVGGMVAACLAALLALIGIILMIAFAVLWRDWYMRRQLRRGRVRLPREKWRLFKPRKSTQSIVSTPRSERKMKMRMYVPAGEPESRNTTISRTQPHTNAWVTQLTPAPMYEEKVKTIKFDPEEDAVIVADVLPDQTQQTHLRSTQLRATQQPVVVTTNAVPAQPTELRTTQLRSTQVQQPVVLTTAPTTQTTYLRSTQPVATEGSSYFVTTSENTQNLGATQTAYERTTQVTTDGNVTYVPFNTGQARGGSPQLRHTTVDRVIGREPYHVQAQQLSRTARPASGKDDIIITPLIPSTNVDNTNPTATSGAMVFGDSDDEAGNVRNPQSEDLVLF